MPQVEFPLGTTENTAKVQNLAKAGACVANIVVLEHELC